MQQPSYSSRPPIIPVVRPIKQKHVQTDDQNQIVLPSMRLNPPCRIIMAPIHPTKTKKEDQPKQRLRLDGVDPFKIPFPTLIPISTRPKPSRNIVNSSSSKTRPIDCPRYIEFLENELRRMRHLNPLCPPLIRTESFSARMPLSPRTTGFVIPARPKMATIEEAVATIMCAIGKGEDALTPELVRKASLILPAKVRMTRRGGIGPSSPRSDRARLSIISSIPRAPLIRPRLTKSTPRNPPPGPPRPSPLRHSTAPSPHVTRSVRTSEPTHPRTDRVWSRSVREARPAESLIDLKRSREDEDGDAQEADLEGSLSQRRGKGGKFLRLV